MGVNRFMRLRETLNYEPQSLAFGTSGLRGLVSDLTQLEAVINTQGFVRYLRETGQVHGGDTVCLAGDLRPSTTGRVEIGGMGRGEILQAVAWGLADSGLRPVYLGTIPTPALMHFGLEHRQASIMVTGSHIPFDRNGIKFNRPEGEVLKADEPVILERVAAVREVRYAEESGASAFGSDGMLKPDRFPGLPPVLAAGRAGYIDRYLAAFPRGPLLDRRILVYQHSAVGRDLLVEVLERLGARVTVAGRSEEFIPIDTEAVQPWMLRTIQGYVDGAGVELEAVVSTDGDSDRPLLLAVENGRVRFISGDLLGIVVADYLGARHVTVPISVNDAVDRYFAPRGVSVVKTRIGSPHVIAALREVGWEANGGLLTAIPMRIPGGGRLSALPTRDAFLPLLVALYAAFGQGLTLAQCFDRLPPRFGRSDVLRSFPGAVSRRIVGMFQPTDPEIEEVEFNEPRLVVRRRGSMRSEPAPAVLAAELGECRARLEHYFSEQVGYSAVRWLNFLDGVRAGLATGEIVHVRPSGNAPELRVYATADSPERADELVQRAVAPDGVLRRLEAEVSHLGAVAAIRERLQPVLLRGAVRSYAWGGTTFLPAFVGQSNPESRPWAELWFGAHPAAPATAVAGEFGCSLLRLIREIPERVLGRGLVERFGPELPYLLKVLDAREMLSIQVHPNREQARAGFDRENAAGLALDDPRRNYRDPHSKPEVHLALTPFWMLHGFRPLEELIALGDRVPELRPILPGTAEVLPVAGRDPVARQRWLRQLYGRVMTLPQAEVDRILRPLIRRLHQEQPVDRALPDTWCWRAAARYAPDGGSCDRGLFSIYLLNLVQLRPGEGTFQEAGVLHAYLEGATVELMACSDNVLRGGLTPKHVDVPELLRIVRFEEGPPVILRGEAESEIEHVFTTAAEEFELSRIGLQPGMKGGPATARGPECLLAIAGNAVLKSVAGVLELGRGSGALVPHGLVYELCGGATGAEVIRAVVPAANHHAD